MPEKETPRQKPDEWTTVRAVINHIRNMTKDEWTAAFIGFVFGLIVSLILR